MFDAPISSVSPLHLLGLNLLTGIPYSLLLTRLNDVRAMLPAETPVKGALAKYYSEPGRLEADLGALVAENLGVLNVSPSQLVAQFPGLEQGLPAWVGNAVQLVRTYHHEGEKLNDTLLRLSSDGTSLDFVRSMFRSYLTSMSVVLECPHCHELTQVQGCPKTDSVLLCQHCSMPSHKGSFV